MTIEISEIRLKRLKMRSMRRGIKEMDIIFSKFAEQTLADLNDEELDDYERILELSDTDLFAWSTGRQELPETLRSPLLDKLLSLQHMT